MFCQGQQNTVVLILVLQSLVLMDGYIDDLNDRCVRFGAFEMFAQNFVNGCFLVLIQLLNVSY